MMLKVVVYTSCIYMALAATTMQPHSTHHHGHHHSKATHPTHEPSEAEGFSFYYDYHTHILLVRSNRICYLYNTSAQEQMDVHSSHGLHTIEKNVIDIIDSNPTTTTVTHDNLNATSARLGKMCGSRYTIHQLN
ncbi:uncharacterized protein LOC130052688 [Ostrea edulis]|uniref:uncharacterized protein LOC130052688 n=1 Tax=Ostrea edulis TaxID=37623 RepID=UPI0024AF9412|nr:uncharacterized protein LOC130052688 [Ostrea edulis]